MNDVIDISEEVTLASLAVQNSLQDDADEDTDKENMSYLDSLTFEERLSSVVVVRYLLENSGCLDPRVMNSLRIVQRELKLERQTNPSRLALLNILVRIMGKNDLIRNISYLGCI